jgi:glycosyltransferase domain-containing protein
VAVGRLRTDELTTVLATRNQPSAVLAQLRYFDRSGLGGAVLVADSSDEATVDAVRDACGDAADYRHFDPETSLHDKLAEAVSAVETPYVLLCPDKKITFTHATELLVRYLTEHDDYVAAVGYVVRYYESPEEVDINHIFLFAPSIADDDAPRRHYHLMRRYHPSLWAVFRTEALANALAQSRLMNGNLFQEIMFMNGIVAQGKIARLPLVFSLHGQDTTRLSQSHPLYWFCRDSDSFFRNYVRYRNTLAEFMQGYCRKQEMQQHDLREIIDAVHAVWLQREFDNGVLNYSAQLLLGEKLAPLPDARQSPPRLEPDGNVVMRSQQGKRLYIWRRDVLLAEPRDEISISPDELQRVEDQLDLYF